MASGVYLIMDFDHGVGGVEEHTHRIVKHLTRLGERIVVLAPPSPGATAFDAACGYPVIRFELPEAVRGGKLLRRYVRLAKATRAFVRTAKAMRANYVIWAAWGPNPGVGIVLCALALRVPFFLFAHGREFTAVGEWRLVRRLTVRAATGVLCVSDFIRSRVLLGGARRERVVTVPPGLDVGEVDAYRRRARTGRFPRVAAAFPPGVPAVLSVCRLARGKGVDKMIDAMGKIAAAVPGTRYAVLGAGPEADALERRAAESPAAGSITFLGPVTGDEKFAFYERCDVFAMPSEDEGFGLVFLEAGGFGKPVVGGRTAPSTDAVLHDLTGYLVDPRDADAVGDAVIRLLKDPRVARRLGANGERRVQEELSWLASARKVRDIVHGSLRPKHCGAGTNGGRRGTVLSLAWLRSRR